MTDAELLRTFSSQHSQEAFTELVHRHAGLVYRAAIRQLGDHAHLAHDVTQAVFTTLALKAASLPRQVVLAAWLYATTHYVVANTLRTERRRQVRELPHSNAKRWFCGFLPTGRSLKSARR